MGIVKRHNENPWDLKDRFFPAQHANIIIQSIQNGKVGITKLHVTKTKKPHPKDKNKTPDKTSPKDTDKSLYIQIVTNLHCDVEITDPISLHNAVKAVFEIRKNKFEKFHIAKHWNHLTWLVKAESAMALIKNIEVLEIGYVNTKPSYWWFGSESRIHLTIRDTKQLLNDNTALKATIAGVVMTGAFIGGAALGAKGLALGISVVSKSSITTSLITNMAKNNHQFRSLICSLTSTFFTMGPSEPLQLHAMITTTLQNIAPKALPYLENALSTGLVPASVMTIPVFHYDYREFARKTYVFLCGVYASVQANLCFPQIAGMHKFERTDAGHSCFTWARERLFELGEEVINNDPYLSVSKFDTWISMTSQHIPASVSSPPKC